ncbi:MAG TPA: acyl carrier protein [Oscillatoriaceae cyanobacterium]
MRDQQIRTRLIEAVRKEPRVFLSRDLDTAKPEDRLREDLGLDSVGLLYVVMAIEDAFGIAVDDAEDLAEGFTTWGALVSFVSERAP